MHTSSLVTHLGVPASACIVRVQCLESRSDGSGPTHPATAAPRPSCRQSLSIQYRQIVESGHVRTLNQRKRLPTLGAAPRMAPYIRFGTSNSNCRGISWGCSLRLEREAQGVLLPPPFLPYTTRPVSCQVDANFPPQLRQPCQKFPISEADPGMLLGVPFS